jgi:hypothetical protein
MGTINRVQDSTINNKKDDKISPADDKTNADLNEEELNKVAGGTKSGDPDEGGQVNRR